MPRGRLWIGLALLAACALHLGCGQEPGPRAVDIKPDPRIKLTEQSGDAAGAVTKDRRKK